MTAQRTITSMVALALNSSETSTWDVLDGFPKPHSRAREDKTRICTEAPHSKSFGRVEIWQAIYDDRDGLESFTRDPIGFAGTEWGIYKYCLGSPSKFVDPSGLCVGCCCCVEDLFSVVKKKDFDGLQPVAGHEINLLIVMRFVKSNAAKSEGCSLVWWEKTNKWYIPYDTIYKDNEWGVVYPFPLRPGDVIRKPHMFSDWEANSFLDKCPATRFAEITDLPMMRIHGNPDIRNFTRVLEGYVIFKSAENCDCPVKEKVFRFRQIIDFDAAGNADAWMVDPTEFPPNVGNPPKLRRSQE